MMISLIVALTRTGVIGRDNALPWSLPSDLKRFKRLTMGHPIIMGRKTFDSIGRALPGRRNLVITRNTELQSPAGIELFSSLSAALSACKETVASTNEVFVIGGSQIFSEALPLANKLYLTWVEQEFKGDIIFPNFNTFLDDFQATSEQSIAVSELEPIAHTYIDYVRK